MDLPEVLIKSLASSKGIAHDSKKVREGYVFFAVRGTKVDGHDFVDEAVRRGASLVVVERDVEVEGAKVVKVPDTREALGLCADIFFGSPSKKLKVVGVTGTNGKTTVTYIIEGILKEAGFKPGVVGTIGYRFGDKKLGSGRTTPDQITWHKTLRSMLDLGATHVAAEVSSHALDQKRVWGTRFEAVLFTNLSQDHLDYHKDMESYFRAKLRLFEEYEYKFAVVNGDDPYGRRIAKRVDAVTYGREGEVKIEDFRTGMWGSEIKVSFRGRSYTFRTNLVGDFQAYNLACSIAYAFLVGIEPSAVERALKGIRVPGRFETVRSKEGFTVVVDYAHTPDAMENILRTLRRVTEGRVITVFGAGGDRDRSKRPLMGKAAERWSDLIILTSDNPRSEDPLKIIEDILRGVDNKDKVLIEPDRRTAIRVALERAKRGDVVAVLGKGHEEYQEIGGVKYPFSDVGVVKELLSGGGDGL